MLGDYISACRCYFFVMCILLVCVYVLCLIVCDCVIVALVLYCLFFVYVRVLVVSR